MKWILNTRARFVAVFAVFLALAGCKEVLYSELSEADANEMVALLVLSGVPASRERDSTLTYAVKVEEADLPIAVTVLKNAGLPRERFANLGEVFGDSGVVGTPFEERVRFAYATNEELSHTITQIKGIERTRVHVVIPPEGRFGKTEEPARASVAIFHDKSFDPANYSGRIKTMVAYAVPGLQVESVSVSFFLTPGFVVQSSGESQLPGAAMASPGSFVFGLSVSSLPWIEIGLFICLLILLRGAMLAWRQFAPFQRKSS